MPASDSIVDHLLKLQQQHQHQHQHHHQQNQQHQHHHHHQQQQQHPHVFLEHLLKQHQQFSGANHPNVATQQFLQDNSSLDHHLEELRQRQNLLELLLRRQQEEQFQAQQHARFLQQQQLKLDERRVSGVWEVDEFGQFVRTQASTPMQAHGAFQQQQQELLLHHQPSFPPMLQPQAQKLQLEASGLHGINLQQPKADMRAPLDFQADRNLAALLEGASRMDSVPSDFFPHLQGERGGFERQSSIPEHGSSIPLAMDVLRQSRANEASGRAWGTGSHSADMDLMELYQAGEGMAPKRMNHLFKQNQLHGLNWPQDMSSVNDNLQNFPVNSDFLRQSPRDNQGVGFRMQQEQQGRRTGHGLDEDLSRLLTSSSPSKQRDFPASMFYNEDPFMSNLSGSNHQVDSFGRIMHSTPQAAWNGATPTRAKRDDADWQRAESTSHFDLLTPTQPPRQPMVQGEASDFWGTSASMIQEQSSQLPAFVHSSFDIGQGELARESAFDLGANGNVVTLSTTANSNSSSLMRDASDSAAAIADEGEFMESKDSKKNKKRNAKAKVNSAGKAASVTVPDAAIPPVGKSSKLPHMFEDFTSVTPPAPSLGDFLLRKEEQMYSQSLPVWSVDPNMHVKAAKSLKDIQEAEKKARDEHGQLSQQQIQTPTPKPSNPIMISSNISAWQRPLLSSPSQFVQSRNQSSSLTHPGSGKSKTEDDDQFWDYGDIGVTKQAFRTDWQDNSQLLMRDHSTTGVSVKGSENLPYQGSVGAMPASGFSAAVSKQASMKSASKQAEGPPQVQLSVMEARVFRQWCESQIRKFNGKGHMALLEFCMSLPSVSEAGDYLTMYLGNEPSVEAFKAEFIRHKAMIPPEVAQVVFPVSDAVIKDELVDPYEGEKRTDMSYKKPVEEDDNDFETVRSGKRKGRKGKKVVDPSLVLGFSVSNSNRILMGEIQHMND